MAVSIHPSAVVPKDVVIGDGTVIHPFVVIASGVKIGENNIIAKGVSIHKNVSIGNGNYIGENTILGCDPSSLSFDCSLETGVIIGNDNNFKGFVTVERATTAGGYTQIGNKNLFMMYTYIAHDCTIFDEVVIVSNTALAGHIYVDSHSFISAGCLFHQFVRIGKGVMVGALSKVGNDIPPYTLVEGYIGRYRGINFVGLKRAGFNLEQRNLIKHIYHCLYQGTFSQGIEAIAQLPANPIRDEILNFLRGSKERSIIRKNNKEDYN